MRETRRTWARAALGGVLAVTAAWWALALWPLPAAAPDWLSRTRAVCFGTTPSGLPDVQGWMLLFLQPTLMLAQVLAIWGGELGADASRMSRSRRGRLALAIVAMTFSAVDDTLAPPGGEVLWLWAQYFPYEMTGGRTWDAIGDEVAETILDAFEPYAPGTKASVVGRLFQHPLWLERELGLRRGNLT